MKIIKSRCRLGVAMVLICSLPFGVMAQQTVSGGQSDAVPAQTAAVAPQQGLDNPFGVAADIGALADLRGGAEINRTEMTLSGTTSGNVADQVITGSNVISAGSFASMSGIPLVVQNSGANVLIQNAVIVNVKME